MSKTTDKIIAEYGIATGTVQNKEFVSPKLEHVATAWHPFDGFTKKLSGPESSVENQDRVPSRKLENELFVSGNMKVLAKAAEHSNF